jgi:hypothetical protein
VFEGIVKDAFLMFAECMPEWGYWSLFFIVSLASLAAARGLDRGFGGGSSSSGGGVQARTHAPSSTPSSLVPHSVSATPRPEPLSVQVPLD